MNMMRSFTRMAPVVAPRAAPVAAAATTAHAAPAATPQATHQAPEHHGHHGPHRSGGQGRHVGGNRPGARPKRSTTNKTRRTRRRGANGLQGDDDDHDFHSAESQQTGTEAVHLKDQSQDSGDDQDRGGNEESRQEKLAQARSLSRKAGEQPGRGDAPRRVFDSKIPLQRCKKGMLGVVQQAVVDSELNKAAQTNNGVLAASALRKLNLALLGSTRAGARLDSGGLAAVADYLIANYIKPAKPEGGFALPIQLLHLMLPMKLLQLQVPRTEEQAALSIAKMLVQSRRNPS